jgi:hypothetical protein
MYMILGRFKQNPQVDLFRYVAPTTEDYMWLKVNPKLVFWWIVAHGYSDFVMCASADLGMGERRQAPRLAARQPVAHAAAPARE